MPSLMLRLLRPFTFLSFPFGLGLAAQATAEGAAATGNCSITEFGAIAGGTVVNTAAIQAAIDAAAAKGGGTVVVPAGVFRSGSVFLKQGVELQLAAGAVLLGSENIADYPKQQTRIEGHFEPWRMALVNAAGLDRLRISGPGKLDGSGAVYWAAFWKRREENPRCTNLEVERPRLLFIDRCRNVRIEGITLENSGFWNLHLYCCDDVVVDGVNISAPAGPVHAPSSDGIDVDSSRNVTIRHCRIAVDDDCIALKGSKGPFAEQDRSSPPVENILIEHCEFGSGNGVLTCGSEATIVRHVVVRECTVSGKNVLVCLKLRPDTPQHYEDLLFENIRFVGGVGRIFQIKPWTQFFDLQGQPQPTSVVRKIVVRNLSGNFGGFGVIGGNPGDVLDDITVENAKITLLDRSFKVGAVKNLIFRNVIVNGQAMISPVKS